MRSIFGMVAPARRRVLAEFEFAVAYDGDALDDGRIPVRDLAPSLLAMAQMFRDGNALLNPNGPEVQLEIRASERGSWLAQLLLIDAPVVVDVPGMIWNELDSDAADKLSNLFQFCGVSLLLMIQQVRNRPYERRRLDNGQDRVTTSDGDSIDVPPEAADLYENNAVRRSARSVVAPLRREGIDRIRVRRNDADVVTVETADVDSFETTERDEVEPLTDNTSAMYLLIETPQVDAPAQRKWRFSTGEQGSRFAALIDDPGFLDEVVRGVRRFGHGDYLLADVRHRQYPNPGGPPRNDWTITRVIRHDPGAVVEQGSLFENGGPAVDDTDGL